MDKIRIGVSKCLLGEPVRYDGQHKHDHFITDTLGRHFDYVGFAKVFMAHFPTLPCEDEGRLNDPDLRENFIERVFTLWRFRQAVRAARHSLR